MGASSGPLSFFLAGLSHAHELFDVLRGLGRQAHGPGKAVQVAALRVRVHLNGYQGGGVDLCRHIGPSAHRLHDGVRGHGGLQLGDDVAEAFLPDARFPSKRRRTARTPCRPSPILPLEDVAFLRGLGRPPGTTPGTAPPGTGSRRSAPSSPCASSRSRPEPGREGLPRRFRG